MAAAQQPTAGTAAAALFAALCCERCCAAGTAGLPALLGLATAAAGASCCDGKCCVAAALPGAARCRSLTGSAAGAAPCCCPGACNNGCKRGSAPAVAEAVLGPFQHELHGSSSGVLQSPQHARTCCRRRLARVLPCTKLHRRHAGAAAWLCRLLQQAQLRPAAGVQLLQAWQAGNGRQTAAAAAAAGRRRC